MQTTELEGQGAVKRFRKALLVALLVAAVMVAGRWILHERSRSAALAVVVELGGRIGSITAPFGGTEYYVTFRGCALKRGDIDRLIVLNDLARWSFVGLGLQGATISAEDRDYIKQQLPAVHISPAQDEPVR